MAHETNTNIVDAELELEEIPLKPSAAPVKHKLNKKKKRKTKKVKTINKNSIETFKTITLTILITALVAFPLGMRYESQQQAKIDAAKEQAVQSLKPEPPSEA